MCYLAPNPPHLTDLIPSKHATLKGNISPPAITRFLPLSSVYPLPPHGPLPTLGSSFASGNFGCQGINLLHNGETRLARLHDLITSSISAEH